MPGPFLFDDVGPVALEDLQCNTLRSTERARCTQVFRRFADAGTFRTWLRERAPEPSRASAQSATLVNLLFTKEGLALLGESENTFRRMDPAFSRGSRDRATLDKLGDGITAGWGAHKAPWHVVEMYSHDGDIKPDIVASSDYVIEYGSGIDQHGKLLEQAGPSYGYLHILDGISKLAYTQQDYDKLVHDNGGREPIHWDPRHPLSSLLVRDVLTDRDDSFGSYFVFRKYRQDIAKLDQRIAAIAEEIEDRRRKNPSDQLGTLSPEQRGFEAFRGKSGAALHEQIKQWVFGRGTDGTTGLDDAGEVGNDFNYQGDSGGSKCPLHAHIRKMNPRGRTGDLAGERTRAIARRGTSGYRTKVHTPSGSEQAEQTALLFWCAQASIGEQFEYIQERWANSSNVDLDLLPTPDVDTVIGRLHPKHKQPAPGASHWDRWKTTSDVAFDIWDVIQLVGAEYLYAPSLAGVAALKAR